MLGTAPRSSSPHVHALLAFLLPMSMHGLAGQVTFESGLANMVKTPPANPSAPQIGHLAPPETRQWLGSASLGRTRLVNCLNMCCVLFFLKNGLTHFQATRLPAQALLES